MKEKSSEWFEELYTEMNSVIEVNNNVYVRTRMKP